jgi:hypothetical protein
MKLAPTSSLSLRNRWELFVLGSLSGGHRRVVSRSLDCAQFCAHPQTPIIDNRSKPERGKAAATVALLVCESPLLRRKIKTIAERRAPSLSCSRSIAHFLCSRGLELIIRWSQVRILAGPPFFSTDLALLGLFSLAGICPIRALSPRSSVPLLVLRGCESLRPIAK